MRLNERWMDWALLAVVAVLVIRGWLGPGIPTSPREEVLAEFNYAWVLREWMRQGHWLFEWNPYEFAGFPWVRYLPYPVYRGVAMLALLPGFSLQGALRLFYFLAFACSAVAMYELARVLLDRRGAALVAALAYETFPFHIHTAVEIWVHAAFWAVLPLPLLAYEMARHHPAHERRYGLLAGLAGGLLVIVNVEHALIAAPFLGLYILVREGEALLKGKRRATEAAYLLALIGCLALGVSAFLTLPGWMEMAQVGINPKFGQGTDVLRAREALLTYFAASPQRFLAAMAQRLRLKGLYFGDPALLAEPLGRLNLWYPGLIVPLLALPSLLRPRKSLTLWALLALALSFSMGLPVAIGLPVVGRFHPHRWMIMVAFFLALLAGMGMRVVSQKMPGKAGRAAMLATLLLVFVDYYRPASWVFMRTTALFSPHELAAYRWLQEQGDDFRIWEYSYPGWQLHRYFHSQSYHGLPRFDGYFDNGATAATWRLYNLALPEKGRRAPSPFLTTALRLASVKYALFRPEERLHARFMELLRSEGWYPVWESEDVVVLQDPLWEPLVRGYTMGVLSDHCSEGLVSLLPALVEKDVALICGRDLRPVPGLLPLPEEATEEDLRGLEGRKATPSPTWSRPSPEEIRVDVEAKEPLLLVVAESWYPNWHVYVDGEERPLLRANYAFMGVWVEEGEHQVVFRYQRPWYVYAGYAISLLTLAVGVMVWKGGRIGK